MSNILVTGGMGYIGSVVVEQLLSNHNVIVIDDLRDTLKNNPDVGVKFHKEDFGNELLLDKIFKKEKIDVVIHLAASANVPDSVINPKIYYKNNVSNSIQLLNSMLKNNINRIIFSSTAAVYGEPKTKVISENNSLSPINPYGHSKLFFEKILYDYHQAYNLSFQCLRYFCVAGATESNGELRKSDETHLIPSLVDTALGKRSFINIYGNDYDTHDGTCVRDFLHVIDVARAHILCLEYSDSDYFNLGTNKGYSVLETIEATRKILNKDIISKLAPRREADPSSLVASNTKAKNKLNWIPKYGLDEMILSTFNWRKKFIKK